MSRQRLRWPGDRDPSRKLSPDTRPSLLGHTSTHTRRYGRKPKIQTAALRALYDDRCDHAEFVAIVGDVF